MFKLALITLLAYDANHSMSDYNQIYTWKKEYNIPKIVICNDNKVSKNNIIKASNYWKRKGYKLGKISYEKNNSCKKDYIKGAILIAGKRYNYKNNSQGNTSPWTDGKDSTIMVSALIEIPKKHSQDLSLIIHELGHAIGLGHTNHKGHMMYPYEN
jgi:predicted Zn-dependent protease